jgi:hypothetical protein
MLTCSVLRCTNPGSAFIAGNRCPTSRYQEACICTEHKALIDAGSPWDMDGGTVLMGQDLAPVLENWSARPSVGSEGFTLTLDIAGQIRPFEVFLMPTEARTLSTFIDAANGDADNGHP